MHSLAFIQWRLKYPNKTKHNPQWLQAVLTARVRNLCMSLSFDQKISHQTDKNGYISPSFFTKYLEYFSPQGVEQPFLVNSFQSIGWQDPFPNEERSDFDDMQDDQTSNIKFPSLDAVNEDVYPGFRYLQDTSPYCLYIPNKEVMFKMMRACIKVLNPEDLWISSKAD